MTEAKINGINVRYEDSGSGAAVFLTHGYAATGRMWEPQRKALNDAGYRLITWDMRGHGGTDSPDDPAQYSEALRSEEHTSELQSHHDLHSFPTRRSSDLRSTGSMFDTKTAAVARPSF